MLSPDELRLLHPGRKRLAPTVPPPPLQLQLQLLGSSRVGGVAPAPRRQDEGGRRSEGNLGIAEKQALDSAGPLTDSVARGKAGPIQLGGEGSTTVRLVNGLKVVGHAGDGGVGRVAVTAPGHDWTGDDDWLAAARRHGQQQQQVLCEL
jgi:hypothetical protein